MKTFILSRIKSFRFAFHGWWHVIRTQRNAWIHAVVSLAVLAVSAWLHISLVEWAVILLTIALVWTAEFLNTALEAVVDLASPEHHDLAKIGKDVGAAAVLIAAGASILVGFLILGPPLWRLLQSWLAP
jgi:diacylglycerol kinase (ATP)